MKCDKCHKEIVIKQSTGGGCGYGENKAGEKVCYACCAEDDKQFMREHDKTTLYLDVIDSNRARVTNWPASLVFDNCHYKTGSHNIAGIRYDTWFWFENVQWHGVRYGNNTQILHCQKTKAKN